MTTSLFANFVGGISQKEAYDILQWANTERVKIGIWDYLTCIDIASWLYIHEREGSYVAA